MDETSASHTVEKGLRFVFHGDHAAFQKPASTRPT